MLRPIPNSDADDKDYALLRNLFGTHNFDLEHICRRLHITKLHHLDPTSSRQGDFGPLDPFLSLFVEGKPVGRDLLGAETVALLERLNLIASAPNDAVSATVALYPIEHLYIASDRYNSPDDKPFEGFDDIVYPCLFETTDRFLRMIPREDLKPGAVVLDLCSGTGVAGLLQARHADQVYALDIADRSTSFAKFNQRLNGISNFTALTGDLYEPVAGIKFDCIVVHPPYQPVFKRQQIFNSGGIDGEEITSRCVEQSYGKLHPGGRLYCTAQITSRELSVADRVRQWIEQSAQASDFDVAHFITKVHELEGFASKAILNAGGTMTDFRLWMRDLARLGVRQLDYGLLIVERHAGPRQSFTITRHAHAEWNRSEFEFLVSWESGKKTSLWDMSLRANPNARLEVIHALVESGGWEVSGYRLSATAPFKATIEGTQSLAFLVSLFVGGKNVKDVFQSFLAAASIGRSDFEAAVSSMVSEGFLIL